jgi:hypothetical protein
MDEVFGRDCQRNQVVWCYGGGSAPKGYYHRKHDNLFWYSKSKESWTFNRQFRPYESRKEIIKVPKRMGVEGELPGVVQAGAGEFVDFEERWTGSYIFENEWQSFRTRQSRDLELTTVSHAYPKPGHYTIAVKVIDIFGNDTMTLMPVSVG